MRPSRRVVYFSLLLLLFTTGGVSVRAWSSERTSSQDYRRYQFELAEAYIQTDQDWRAAAELRAALRYDSGYPRAQRRLREVERRLSSGKNQK